ncbi:MAG TPA: LPS export ABC transporter periplasmic protein LptC [Candidatus Anaerobiospirillum stercoravium]|nr:LPS export ABC transporter periplasmic protein LptC [Candidatus Anaerobiospirillum stercoravium]
MSVTVRSIIIAALLSIAAALLYRYSANTGKLSADEINERFPSFTATNFTAELYNEKGLLNYSIFARDVSFYESRDLITADYLAGFYYDHEDLVNQPGRGWQIIADQGEVVFDRYAKLTGNVHVQPNFPTSPIEEIITPYVHFDLTANIISSPETITIRGRNFENQGANYEIDLNQNTFVIKDHPHVVYHPET